MYHDSLHKQYIPADYTEAFWASSALMQHVQISASKFNFRQISWQRKEVVNTFEAIFTSWAF